MSVAFYWGMSDEESDREEARFRAQVQREVLRAYGLKPWDIGLRHPPARVRLWRWLRRARRDATELAWFNVPETSRPDTIRDPDKSGRSAHPEAS